MRPVTPRAAGHPRHAQAAPGHARCAPQLQGARERRAESPSPSCPQRHRGTPWTRRPPAARAATGAARALTCSGAAASRPASTGPAVLRGRPAKQQPGQAPYGGGGTRAGAASTPGPARLQQQAVPLAGPLCVVFDGIHEALVDTHGLLPSRRCDSWRAEPPRAVVSVRPRPRQLAQAARGAYLRWALSAALSKAAAFSRFIWARSLTSDTDTPAC